MIHFNFYPVGVCCAKRTEHKFFYQNHDRLTGISTTSPANSNWNNVKLPPMKPTAMTNNERMDFHELLRISFSKIGSTPDVWVDWSDVWICLVFKWNREKRDTFTGCETKVRIRSISSAFKPSVNKPRASQIRCNSANNSKVTFDSVHL